VSKDEVLCVTVSKMAESTRRSRCSGTGFKQLF